MHKFFRRKVQRGYKLGRKLGFPTVNLNVGHFGEHYSRGVYICRVHIRAREYPGLLYYGPKLAHPGKTLEIYIHGFSGNIYGRFIRFKVGRYLRAPKSFNCQAALQNQIQKDLLHLSS